MKAKIAIFKKLVETASQEELRCMSGLLQQQISHQGSPAPMAGEPSAHLSPRHGAKDKNRR